MTEVSVDGINHSYSKLTGDSQLIILLKSPEGIKGISKKISNLKNIEKIQRGLYIFPHLSHDLKSIIKSHPLVSFVKTREIPVFNKRMEDVYSKLVYSIVAFSFKRPSAKQKKYVERLIKKSTGIRLRPGVIIFPILRTKQQRKIIGPEGMRVLLTSTEFARLVGEHGGRVVRWSRLRITNSSGADRIERAIEQTLLKDLESLERRIQNLRERSKKTGVEITQLKRKYSILSRDFRMMKKKWVLSQKIWFYDTEKPLKRTYNMLINTKRLISGREEGLPMRGG